VAEPGMDILKQIRKACNDIAESFRTNKPSRAEYQFFLLRKMIDERRHPWSHYQPQVDEEFGE
jgi:hypothetical protein